MLVRVTHGGSTFYKKGTYARLTSHDGSGSWWADFRGLDNPAGSFRDTCDGVWSISEGLFVVVEGAAVGEPPAPAAFQAGDVVRIVRRNNLHQVGALATLKYADRDGDWWADFRGLGNPAGSFAAWVGDHICVGRAPRFELHRRP